MSFKLGMDEDSSRFTSGLSGWANLLDILLGWDSPSISVQVNIFQYSSGIGIVDSPVGFWLGSELGLPLWDMLYSYIWPHFGLQLIVYIPYGSKVSQCDLLVSPSWYTLAPPSGMCLTSSSQTTLSETLYGGWPTLPRRRGRNWHCRKAKGDNKVENKLEFLVGLGVSVASILSLWHLILFSNILVTPPSCYLINFLYDDFFLFPNFSSSAQRSITKFGGYFSPWGGLAIWLVCLGPLFNYIF